MALQPLSDVLRWQSYANTSGARWGIPPAVLLGLVHEESGGQEGLTSSAGAQGLTQFEPGTARSYGVNVAPGHAASQIDGAAHYLHDLGFGRDPRRALASYAAGPANIAAGYFYADNVLGKLAPLYGSTHTPAASSTTSPASSTTSPASSTTPAASSSSSSSSGGLVTGERRSGLLRALLTAGTVVTGAALAWKGADAVTGGGLSGTVAAVRSTAATIGEAGAA